MNALLLIVTGLLVLMNAFFVMAEYALVRSRASRLEALAEAGVRGARLAHAQTEAIGDYIAACQVGITMASIGIGALGEPTIAHLLEHPLGGPLGHTVAVVISVIISYLLIITAQSTVGEIVPKLYVLQHAEGVARRIARPLQFFRTVVPPVHRRAEPVFAIDPARRSGPILMPRTQTTGRPRTSSGSSPTRSPAARSTPARRRC